MATARQRLHAELVSCLRSGGPDVRARLEEVVDGYRVQLKAGKSEGKTARQVLLEKLHRLASRPPADIDEAVSKVLDGFRMQRKAQPGAKGEGERSTSKRRAATRDLSKGQSEEPGEGRKSRAKEPPPAAEKSGGAKRSRRLVTPVVPRRPRSTRTECPKCHSLGVVVARSYASDEYYSCIYCGWQAYKSPEPGSGEDDLAMRLLGLAEPPGDGDE